jgi:predicted nucleic acid-binding protein
VIALALIDRLGLLNRLFGRVAVPEEVHREVMEGGRTGAGVAAYQAATWIEVAPLANPVDPLLATLLDRGEASVIQLARERGTSTVLIDERKARRIARDVYRLPVIGTARVLVDAKREGLLASATETLQAMRDVGYYLSDAIMAEVRRQAGET